MTTALGITKSDDYKFLSVKTFDFEPRSPVGLVAAIDAFRHNALKTAFAS